jgi:hypothetical protein
MVVEVIRCNLHVPSLCGVGNGSRLLSSFKLFCSVPVHVDTIKSIHPCIEKKKKQGKDSEKKEQLGLFFSYLPSTKTSSQIVAVV